MRKNVIIKEFNQFPVPGVLSMKEKTNFMNGKMMNIDDEFRISYTYNNSTILNPTNSNININTIIDNLNNISYDNYKQNSIKLLLNNAQSEFNKNNNTEWVFEFNSNKLLREYLYNEIYTYNPDSPFKQIPDNILNGNKINLACYDYIDKNILNRYKLKEFILWTEYFPLNINNIPGTNPPIKLLKLQPLFNINAIPNANIDLNKKSINIKEYSDGIFDINYTQSKSSQFFTFIYYFDVIYTRA